MRFSQFVKYGALIMLLGLTVSLAHAQSDETTATEPLTLVWQTDFSPDNALITPTDIALDTQGNLYITTQGSDKIKVFDSAGNFINEWGSNGDGEGEFQITVGIAVDADGNVYVSDFGNKRIQKFDNTGGFLLEWATDPSLSPGFMVADAAGDLYIDTFPPHDQMYIQKFDGRGNLITQWGNPDSGEWEFGGRIEDITLDQAGNLYIADPLVNSVHKFDAEGNFVFTLGGEASDAGNGQFDAPFGIAVDGEDNIYVLDTHFLQKLDADGNFISQWSTADGDLDRAVNVAVDWAGNLYILAYADVTAANGSPINTLVLKKFTQPSWK